MNVVTSAVCEARTQWVEDIKQAHVLVSSYKKLRWDPNANRYTVGEQGYRIVSTSGAFEPFHVVTTTLNEGECLQQVGIAILEALPDNEDICVYLLPER